MESFFSKRGRVVTLLIIIFVSFVLAVSAVSMLSQYARQVSEHAKVTASYNTLGVKERVITTLDDYMQKSSMLAGVASTFTNDTELGEYFRHIKQIEGYDDVKTIRYYRNGKIYNESGDEYTGEDSSRRIHDETPDKTGFIGIYADTGVVDAYGQMQMIGFYSPVANSDVLDGIVVYYPRESIKQIITGAFEENLSEFSVLCTSEGTVVIGSGELNTNQLLTEIRRLGIEKSPVDELERLLLNHSSGTIEITIDESSYLISVVSDYDSMNNLSIVELYDINVLSKSTFDLIHTIIAIMILFAVIVLGLIGFLVLSWFRITNEIFNNETHDRGLNCYNRHGFEAESAKILNRNPSSNFFVVSLQLRHYKFLTENYGEDVISDLVRYLRKVLQKFKGLEEVFGHITEGQFLILLHNADRQALLERLKILSFLCSQYKSKQKFDVLTTLGIYEIGDQDKTPVPQMIDFANEAKNDTTGSTALTSGMQINFYSEELRIQRQFNDDMELRMDGALKNGEFQIFMQPKFNLNTGHQDGCEALVRWYDPKKNEYNRPALFMQLFESNGFITKLDRYVFTKVCEYLSYSIAQGRPVYPVSVNISRVTAIEPDFAQFYADIKRKYGIRNGLITLEFTESFAYENYETLVSIVNKLHANGFECSIDDFGCGYSSYLILKSLPMDEIKLDKIFLNKGISDERDNHIFESIIDLSKRLHMKVTQEGIETYEDLIRMKNLHCDAIQGYFYARPLPLSDYIAFVGSSHSHDVDMTKPVGQ